MGRLPPVPAAQASRYSSTDDAAVTRVDAKAPLGAKASLGTKADATWVAQFERMIAVDEYQDKLNRWYHREIDRLEEAKAMYGDTRIDVWRGAWCVIGNIEDGSYLRSPSPEVWKRMHGCEEDPYAQCGIGGSEDGLGASDSDPLMEEVDDGGTHHEEEGCDAGGAGDARDRDTDDEDDGSLDDRLHTSPATDHDDEEGGRAGGAGGAPVAADERAGDSESTHPAASAHDPSAPSGSVGGETKKKRARGRGGGRAASKPKQKRGEAKQKRGGASFRSSDKEGRAFLAANLKTPTHAQTPDTDSLVLFRTDALAGTRKNGENCASDALNFALGDASLVTVPDLAATSKELYGERTMPSLAIITQTIQNKKLPFKLQKARLGRGPRVLLALLRMSEGIFVVCAEVRDGAGAMVKHFYGVDVWRRVIYDNDEDRSKAYCVWDDDDTKDEDSAKALFADLGLVNLLGVYVVKVFASRRGETAYYGD